MSLMTRARRDYARQPYASRLIAASFFPLTKFPLTKRGENAIENRGGLAIIRGTKKWIAITALSSSFHVRDFWRQRETRFFSAFAGVIWREL